MNLYVKKCFQNINMNDLVIIEQLFAMIIFYSMLHFWIEIELPDHCIVERQGDRREDLILQSRREKGKIFSFSAILSTVFTCFTIIFFWLSIRCLDESIEISSIVLGAGGAVYVASDSISFRATYWDRLNRNPVREDLLKRKGILIHVLTGLFLITYGFLIRIFLII